jgi:exopolysaccharide biosynthesis predicted pyruvyltransferase EpsI
MTRSDVWRSGSHAGAPMAAMRQFAGELKATLFRCLNPLLPIEPPFALVDLPNHANVGDSAIFLGELAWLEAIGAPPPSYICDTYSYSESDLRQHVPHGTILIHGGGNLGDLWTSHQALRERIVSAFPGHRIVQLPQTIHFQSASALERAAALFSRHEHLAIVARDRVSFDIASTGLGSRALLAPDSAFALGNIARVATPSQEVVWLVRTDKESSSLPVPGGVHPVDWLRDDATILIRLERWLRAHQTGVRLRNRLRRRLASERLVRGCITLSRGRTVVSDRLHAHILSLMMGIPHVVVDNSYGKIRSFVDTWTRGAPGVRFCADWSEVDRARQALAEGRFEPVSA